MCDFSGDCPDPLPPTLAMGMIPMHQSSRQGNQRINMHRVHPRMGPIHEGLDGGGGLVFTIH